MKLHYTCCTNECSDEIDIVSRTAMGAQKLAKSLKQIITLGLLVYLIIPLQTHLTSEVISVQQYEIYVQAYFAPYIIDQCTFITNIGVCMMNYCTHFKFGCTMIYYGTNLHCL